MYENLLSGCDKEWKEILENALNTMDKDYLDQIQKAGHWLPGVNQLFSAFSLPLSQTRYILLGESPYPREVSANGYAFWDNSVGSLWSPTGLSKEVNRATSLRNWIKMLLIARGDLQENPSQGAIVKVDKSGLVQTAKEFFKGMMKKGILLLNASLVYSKGRVPYHARQWRPFMQSLFDQLAVKKTNVQLILFGKIAEKIPENKLPIALVSEHPYNVSFITNQRVIEFFKPMDLLSNDSN
ncbi:uracil-DNA glycosylase [Legionella norrlandica]|uniref:Uracil-DNA glycosylase n=1 Tax=Legionella norrlandica TaxID=1498499 RepID=A0A0A2T861_9GAMM|nr:uracil-DNA glycosylase [Legionella norrlandica]KGP63608.1 uracil-DNA glycosylase [Legionella norrlandica]